MIRCTRWRRSGYCGVRCQTTQKPASIEALCKLWSAEVGDDGRLHGSRRMSPSRRLVAHQAKLQGNSDAGSASRASRNGQARLFKCRREELLRS